MIQKWSVMFAVCDDTCIWNYHLIVINESTILAALVWDCRCVKCRTDVPLSVDFNYVKHSCNSAHCIACRYGGICFHVPYYIVIFTVLLYIYSIAVGSLVVQTISCSHHTVTEIDFHWTRSSAKTRTQLSV